MQPVVVRGVPVAITAEDQRRNDDRRWRGMYLTLLGFGLIVGMLAYTSAPAFGSLAFLLLVVCCLAALLRPVVGIYLLVFLAMIGDSTTMEWWPFTKNMSSRESLLFVNDQLILTPFEALAAVTAAAWLIRRLGDPTWRFVRGRMFWPIAAFMFFVVAGILRGRATGGDTRIAVFEFRPLFYVPLIYVLVTNLFTTRRQYRRLLMFCMLAVSIQSVFALVHYRGLPALERDAIESLTDHSATVAMNAVFIFTVCAWLYKCRGWLRWSMLVLSVPVVWAYVLSQRRAAMIAFFIGGVIVLVVLYHRRRRAFWFLAPTSAVVTLGLVLATWNAQGAVGLPALAVKSVLFTDQLGEAEASSDAYRVTEAFNLWTTIRASPVTGLGFGQQFFQPVPLPDISFFEFWRYIPHNSVLWIWIKTGFFGFALFMFIIARSVQLGARSAFLVRTREQAAVVVTGICYVVMFIVFAYVDMAWGAGPSVFLGFSLAICCDLLLAADETERVATGVHTRQLESVGG